MTTITLDRLTFEFPTGWLVTKFDDWLFYSQRFQSTLGGGVKAADLIAIDLQGTAWFIEVKDYRLFARTKPSCVAMETAEKIFDTLAALLPAKVHGHIQTEVDFTTAVVHGATALRAVLHLEQPAGSALFPVPIQPLNIQLKLRQLLKAIDTQPIVCDMATAQIYGWRVRTT